MAIAAARMVRWPSVQERAPRSSAPNGAPKAGARPPDHFRRATELDPHFALAYAGLAQGYVMAGYWGTAPRDVGDQAEAAALKALESDETLADAHVALGLVRSFYQWEWSDADRAYRRGLELNPDGAEPHLWYSIHLTAMGRLDEALVEIRRAHEIDPVSLATDGSIGCILYFRHEYDHAIDRLLKTLELESNQPRLYYYLGRAYLANGRESDAIAALVKAGAISGADRRIAAVLGYAYAMTGRTDEARQLLDEFAQPSETWLRPFSVHAMAVTYLGLGDHDRALGCLQELYDARSPLLRWLKVDPLFDSIRADARFVAILRGMGLAGQRPLLGQRRRPGSRAVHGVVKCTIKGRRLLLVSSPYRGRLTPREAACR